MLAFCVFLLVISITNAAVISNQSENTESSTDSLVTQGTIINYVGKLFSKDSDTKQVNVSDFVANLNPLLENDENIMGPLIIEAAESLNYPLSGNDIPSGIFNIEANPSDVINSIENNTGMIGFKDFLYALQKADESLSNDITTVAGTLLSVLDVLFSSEHEANVKDFVPELKSLEGGDEITVGAVLEKVIKVFKLDISKEVVPTDIADLKVKKSDIINALNEKIGSIRTKDVIIALGNSNDKLLDLLVSLQNNGLSIITDLFSNAENSSVSVDALKSALTALDDDATLGEILTSIANLTGFPLAGDIPPPIANIKGALKPLIKLLDARKGKIPVALIASLIGFIIPALLVITVTQILSGLVSVIGIGVGGLVGLVGALLGGLIGGIIDIFKG